MSPNTPALFFCAMTVFTAAHAEETPAGQRIRQDPAPAVAIAFEEQSSEPWRAEVTAWAWLLGVNGDVGARNITADVSASFGDILDASDSLMAFSGRLEIGKGRWGGYLDGMFADIGADDQSGPVGIANIDVAFQQTVLDFGAMYRLTEWDTTGNASNNRRKTSSVDLYAGGRYSHVDIEMTPAAVPSVSRSEGWIDPIVGAKLVMPVSESWHLAANADIGGFGVESDFTWSATGLVGYDFSMFDAPVTVFAGYRAIGWDYSDGSGNDVFIFEVVQHGPILGLSLKF